MKWREANSNAWVSEDGRYSVCRVTYVTEKGPQPKYEAWKRREHPDGPGRLPGNWIDRHTAQLAAETFDATGG